jgi:hypothetical protein
VRTRHRLVPNGLSCGGESDLAKVCLRGEGGPDGGKGDLEPSGRKGLGNR